MDGPKLHRNEKVGFNPQPPLSRSLQGVADGHGPVVFQLERFG